MVSFQCPTCSTRCGAKLMTDHLVDTRHPSVVRTARVNEMLKCQGCGDTAIHELALIQVGTKDYVLLCPVCRSKDIANWSAYPHTTISTGLLGEISAYQSVRDLKCQFCQSNEDIMVSKTGARALVCGECFIKYSLDRSLFFKRGQDEGFLERAGNVRLKQVSVAQNNNPQRSQQALGQDVLPQSQLNQVVDPVVNAAPQMDQDPHPSPLALSQEADVSNDSARSYSTTALASSLSSLSMKQKKKSRTSSRSKDKPRATFENFVPLAKEHLAKLRAANQEKAAQIQANKAPSAPFGASTTPTQPLEELEHNPLLVPRPAKLRYNSLDEYYTELSDHLYFEERIATEKIYPRNVEFNALEKTTFRFDVPYTDKIDGMVKKNLRELDMIPFYKNQSIFVGLHGDLQNVFHCFILDCKLVKEPFTDTKECIEVLVEFYSWNHSTDHLIGYTDLWFIPASVQICRVMTSMVRMKKPLFQRLVLGNEKVDHQCQPGGNWTPATALNESQRAAVDHVMQNPISVIRGPPGTGKTTVIYNIIQEMLKRKTYPILVVAASNFAIDNIAEKFLGDDSKGVLRILSREKERRYGKKHELAGICLHNVVLDQLSPGERSLYSDVQDNRPLHLTKKEYLAFQKRLRNMRRDVIQSKVVIFTTTVTAGSADMDYSLDQIPVIIMDESTQSSEPISLIPLSIPKVKKFVFVGDEKQLSSFSEIPFLEQSLFERMLKNGSYENPSLLQRQYRMHPVISAFPNKEFYHGELQDGVTAEDKNIGYEPLMFFDYEDICAEEMREVQDRGATVSRSYVNYRESKGIIRVLDMLLGDGKVEASDIGIITPYSGQRDLIANMIKNDKILNPRGEGIKEDIEDTAAITFKKPSTVKTIVGLTVASIDAFQGREKKVVLMSCVRCNKQGTIGFLSDKRRLNVALTRSKSCLFLFGNQRSLRHGSKTWNALLDEIATNGKIDDKLFKEGLVSLW